MADDYSGLEGFSGAGSFEIINPKKRRQPREGSSSTSGGPSHVVLVPWDVATAVAAMFSGDNVIATNIGTTSANQGAHVPISSGKTSGKYYIEIAFTTITSPTGGNLGFGIGTTASTYTNMGNSATGGCMIYNSGNMWGGGSSTGATLLARSSGDVIGIAIDLDNRKIWFKKVSGIPSAWNVASGGSNDPATNVGGQNIPAGTMVPFCTFGGTGGVASNVITLNAGDSPFIGLVPSGFVSGWTV